MHPTLLQLGYIILNAVFAHMCTYYAIIINYESICTFVRWCRSALLANTASLFLKFTNCFLYKFKQAICIHAAAWTIWQRSRKHFHNTGRTYNLWKKIHWRTNLYYISLYIYKVILIIITPDIITLFIFNFFFKKNILNLIKAFKIFL